MIFQIHFYSTKKPERFVTQISSHISMDTRMHSWKPEINFLQKAKKRKV